MEKSGLRMAAYRRFSNSRGSRGYRCWCPWCGEPIDRGSFDLHEAIVKRSDCPKDKQDLIFVSENVVPLHHEPCHMQYGNTAEMTHRCLLALVRVISAEKVGAWYVSMWQEHGLSIPKGLLIPKKDIPMSMMLRLMDLGARVHDKDYDVLANEKWLIEADEKSWDFRSLAAMKWVGRRKKWLRKPPEKWGGVRFADLLIALDEGYWMDYMAGVVGLDLT